MAYCDYHIHSTYCDGSSTCEEIVLTAIEKGLKTVGILAHSYCAFDRVFTISIEQTSLFQQEMKALKEKYKDKINVLCGVEQDALSKTPTDGFDYVLASSHYVKVAPGVYRPLDYTPESLAQTIKKYFKGDERLLLKAYLKNLVELTKRVKPNVIAHIDLLTKFSEKTSLFNNKDKKYYKLYFSSIDEIMKVCTIFEVNVGAISRGYRTSPYPDEKLVEYILSKGGKFVLSSDAHDKKKVAFEFDKYYEKFKNNLVEL